MGAGHRAHGASWWPHGPPRSRPASSTSCSAQARRSAPGSWRRGCAPRSAGPPAPAELEQVLPAGAGQVDGTKEPLASWLRVWDWSPLLPARVLAGLGPVLERVRPLKPAGPADPRTVPAPVPVTATTALTAEDLAEAAEARGPAAAAPPRWPRHRTQATTATRWSCTTSSPTPRPPGLADVPAIPERPQDTGARRVLPRRGRRPRRPPPAPSPARRSPAPSPRARPAPRPRRPGCHSRPEDGRGPGHRAGHSPTRPGRPADRHVAHRRRPGPGQEKDVLAHLHALTAELTDPAADAEEAGDRSRSRRRLRRAVGPARGLPADRSPAAGGPGVRYCWGRTRGSGRWGACSSTPFHQARAREQMPAEVLQAVAGRSPRPPPRTRWPTRSAYGCPPCTTTPRTSPPSTAPPCTGSPRRGPRRPGRGCAGDRPARRCSRPWTAPT